MKIENNKLKEECEVVKFELTNKVIDPYKTEIFLYYLIFSIWSHHMS